MRVYIAYDIVDAPTGGGNQFLRLLREDLKVRNLYSEEPSLADVILFNGHHNISEIAKIKSLDSSKKIMPICEFYKMAIFRKPTAILSHNTVPPPTIE